MTPTEKQLLALRFAAEMELARLEERTIHYVKIGVADMAAMHASDLVRMVRAKDALYSSLRFYPFHEEEQGA
jgi:hypothetical protein